MRHFLLLVALAACTPRHPVVTWVSSLTGVQERVEILSNGDVSYTTTVKGVASEPKPIKLAKEQVEELADMLRAQHACQLAHDPAHTPAPDEGQSTLELAFSDQRCKVTLWNREWLRDGTREIADTMRSMRPLHGH
jgi:hypothetical protein